MYKVLACQYDLLGFLSPFTTLAKILVQQFWLKEREWDDTILPENIKAAWHSWENELLDLNKIKPPQCYSPSWCNNDLLSMELHIFCEALEKAYGSVAYKTQQISVSFVMANSQHKNVN